MKAQNQLRRAPAPLDAEKLRELALRYVGKYATTRARLRQYLTRKIRERGWNGTAPDLDQLSERFAEIGLVDDVAYAMAKSRSLTARGYGKRRLTDQLRRDGVTEDDGAAAAAHADHESIDAALRLARRRRIGPFAAEAADSRLREKWIAMMVRGGHGFALARVISDLLPTPEVDFDQLIERVQQFEV